MISDIENNNDNVSQQVDIEPKRNILGKEGLKKLRPLMKKYRAKAEEWAKTQK